MLYEIKNVNGIKTPINLTAGIGAGLPIGTIISLGKDEVPEGYLKCDGSEFDVDKYPALYLYLGTNKLPEIWDPSKFSNPIVITPAGFGESNAITIERDGLISINQVGDSDNNFYIKYAGTDEYVRLTGVVGTEAFSVSAGSFFVHKGDMMYSTGSYLGTWTIQYFEGCTYIKATVGVTEQDATDLFNQIKSYMNDQNELSDWETITIPKSSAENSYTTAYECPYDGVINGRFDSDNNFNVTVALERDGVVTSRVAHMLAQNTTFLDFTVDVKKGDKLWYYIYAGSGTFHSIAQYYKKRDYSSR